MNPAAPVTSTAIQAIPFSAVGSKLPTAEIGRQLDVPPYALDIGNQPAAFHYARDVLAVPPAIAGVRHGCNHRLISPVQRRAVELKTLFMRPLLRIGARNVDRHFMASPIQPFSDSSE